MLSETLRPGDANPLALLHQILSEGIHAKSDADCLVSAIHIRQTLEYLINELMRTKESRKKYLESVKSLLDKKAEQEKE